MNEIVKYHNDFSNQVVLKKFNANELNFLMAICAKMRNQETNEIIFTFEQLKELTKWSRNDNKGFVESLESTNKKLLALNFTIKENRKTIQFVLFPTFITDDEKKILKVRVNEDFKYLLNGLSSNFTRFELENFTILQSKYSKILYKELMKFKGTGYLIMTIEDFRNKLDIPVKYRMTHINEKVLTPINEELSKILKKFEIKKIKKGRNIDKIEFSFTPIKNEEIETVEICEIEQYWIDNFSGVNYTSKHKTVIEKLLKTMNESQVINYLQEQWDYVKNNAAIENEAAYFSSLILGEKAVLKDYVSQNKQEELSPEEDRKQAEEFMKKVSQFRQTDINEVIRNMEEIKNEEKEKTIEITEEEYEEKFNLYMKKNNLNDVELQRKIFNLMNKNKYKIIKKKIYTAEDIDPALLVSKLGKKLTGNARQVKIKKILLELNK